MDWKTVKPIALAAAFFLAPIITTLVIAVIRAHRKRALARQALP